MITNRIKRFVDPGVLDPGVVADFDAAKNILRIDKFFFDRAPKRVQTLLWRAETTLLVNPYQYRGLEGKGNEKLAKAV